MKIATLKESGKLVKISKDKIIFGKGDLGNEMYIVLNGVVNIFTGEYSKEIPPLAVLKSGDFFGEMALLEDLPRSTTAIAQEDCIFLVIEKANFEKAIKKDPGFAINIMKSLSNRLRLQTKRYAKLEVEACNLETEEEEEIKVEKVKKKETKIEETKEIVEKTDTFTAPATKNLKHFSITVKDEPELIFSEESLADTFFPPEHILYEVPEPDTYKEYILETKKECPACGSSFNAFLIRHSKLNLDKIEDDFRMIYKNFDPTWYSIWTCPNCYYADFFEEFTKKLHSYHQDAILKKTDTLRKIFHRTLKEERTVDDVIHSYYQAIQSLLLKKNHSRDLGKVWIRLAWLYKDLGDVGMYEKASLQAFAYYYDNYYNSGISSVKEDQQLSYLLGLFYLKFNNPVNARKHFFKAIVKRTGDQRINNQAYDQIQDLKKG